MATGVANIDFGAAPGTQTASIVVTGQGAIISGTSMVEAFLMADSTSDHNAYEHMMVPMFLRCGAVVTGVGFTIYAVSDWKLTGQFNVHWVWI